MKSLAGDGMRTRNTAIAAVFAITLAAGSSCYAGDGGLFSRSKGTRIAAGAPGYQGFGLNYHPGYGYGGDALGTGPAGGYPFYGGPGYPHCPPPLRRFGQIQPFAYYGGPGYPRVGRSNYFDAPGPLQSRPPVVDVGDPAQAGHYGPFTGVPPYQADTLFAPYSSAP